MDQDESRMAIEAVAASNPTLTYFGFKFPGAKDFSDDRTRLFSKKSIGEFERAVAWLNLVPVRQSVNRDHSSYGLKHAAEKWAGDYVSNGMLICAAIHLGFPVEQIHGTLNAMVGVSAKSKWPTGKQKDGGPKGEDI